MARPLTWRRLVPGLIVLGVVAALVAGVLTFARIGKLHGDTGQLYMVTNAATGVIDGTEVWLGGQKIGIVNAVHFQAATVDTTERIAIEMEILSQYFSHIRRDADVQLRPGGSLIGAPVVYITIGSASQPAVRSGDTLRARTEVSGRRSRTADFTALGDSFVAAGSTLKQLSAQVRGTGIEVDHLRRRTEAQAIVVGHAIEQYSSGARSQGSIGRMASDQRLHAAIGHVTAQADSIRRLLTSSQHSLGRFRRDSSIFVDARHVLGTMDTLRARFAAPGIAASITSRPDSALARQLEQTQHQLDSLVHDAKRHPFRYLAL